MILTEEELKNEVWKDIKGYEGLYMVSNMGRIKSKNKMLKLNKKRTNYLHIGLCKNGIKTHFIVHRLVAITFIPNLENKPFVNHINGVRDDNKIKNLEWNTAKENKQHSINILKNNCILSNKRLDLKQILIDLSYKYNNIEVWKPIIYQGVSFDMLYNISSKGKIKSYNQSNTGKLIKPNNNFYNIIKNGKLYRLHITSLLYSTFVEKIEININEVWKICTTDSKYFISNIGNLKNKHGKIIKTNINEGGYSQVTIQGRTHLTHRLVAITYIPNPEKKPFVNHINGIKNDNRIENLEWVTNKENAQHYSNNNQHKKVRGNDCSYSILNESKVLEIFYKNGKYKDIADIYAISSATIYDIKNKRSWKHITKDL